MEIISISPLSHNAPVHLLGSVQWQAKASIMSSLVSLVPYVLMQLPCSEHPGRLMHFSQDFPSLLKGWTIENMKFSSLRNRKNFTKSFLILVSPSYFTVAGLWSSANSMNRTGRVAYRNSAWERNIFREFIRPAVFTSCFPVCVACITILFLKIRFVKWFVVVVLLRLFKSID